MGLLDLIAADMAALFDTDDFGQTVSYDGNDITALVNFDIRELIGENVAYEAEMYIKAEDLAEPIYRDPVVIGSDTWHVFQDDGTMPRRIGEGSVWWVPLYRDERPAI